MTNPITTASVLASHGKWAAQYAANERDAITRKFNLSLGVLDRFEEAIRTAVLEGGLMRAKFTLGKKLTEKEREFWRLVEQTKFHGAMCPCDGCKKVRQA